MIPRWRLVAEIEGWGTLVRLEGGEHRGAEVLLVPRGRVLPSGVDAGAPARRRGPFRSAPDPDALARVEAARKADVLLESLLDDRQLASWRRRHRFRVRTPYGYVELGKLYELGFMRNDGRRFVLCVVPERHLELPEADIWTNLLLVLRTRPEEFLAVANYHGRHGWRPGPVPLRAWSRR